MIMQRGFVALAGGGVDLLQRDRMKAALAEQPLGRLHQARARIAAPGNLLGISSSLLTGSVMKRIREGKGEGLV